MVDIVIVNWNSRGYLKKCIHSILSNKNIGVINRVFIIDNNTSDTSLTGVPVHNKITIVKNTENVGFSRACNQGFKLCTASYVLLLNPDTQLFETTLSDCVEFMNKQEEVDILGCQLFLDDGKIAKSCARFPSPLTMFFDATGLSKLNPRVFKPASLMTDWDHRESRFVDQVIGAFMFMRSSIFKKTGYFDERFFVYFEELDFSKRLAEQGGKSYYNISIKAIHSENGTTMSVKGFRLFLYLKSRLQYAKKHFGYAGYFVVWSSTLLIEPFSRSLLLLVTGKPKEIKDVLKGYRLLLGSLPLS
ncbi:MAG: glycosyltransferase family 2 protein [Ferruginibacter sp.]